jgi:hypothetical protein
MASQSTDLGGDRNQVRPLRSPVPCVRGKVNRHHSTRVSRLHVVLDDGRSGKQTARFQNLLQPPSHPYLTARANARSTRVTANRQSTLVSMAITLSGPLSDANGCLTFPKTRAHSIIPSTSGKLSRNPFRASPSQRASWLRSFHGHRGASRK